MMVLMVKIIMKKCAPVWLIYNSCVDAFMHEDFFYTALFANGVHTSFDTSCHVLGVLTYIKTDAILMMENCHKVYMGFFTRLDSLHVLLTFLA